MAAVGVAVLVAGCGGADEESAAAPSYYLSLGDSLTVGVQPDESGDPEETANGYTDVLYRTLYDSDSTLRHERMGCGGEDTTTFVEGGLPHCDERYEQGSQLEEAEAFLAEHGGQVDLVTLTIGGNNFTRCVEGVRDPDGEPDGPEDIGIDEECVADGLERVETEVPVIAERLRAAAGPDTQIIGMTYYNPFLALLLLDDEPAEEAAEAAEEAAGEAAEESAAPGDGAETETTGGDELAERSVDILTELNESLTATYQAAGVEVADVGAAFESTNGEVPADSDTGMPTNLQNVCDYTWMCNLDRGPDIHTNEAGAKRIAAVFAEQVD
ncbi:SGNH/GDSL hydrolase family protein [Nocardiopsis halotolerans]|uniref:SGNH/GDSL hydrolase family protein n=1 Tax=Nocardiopsis halotolerans TaxID=124252 RepID=UPI00037746EF|nr:GDSL-type esterase/lipase family protein [Nocardiopsis halotolerans]